MIIHIYIYIYIYIYSWTYTVCVFAGYEVSVALTPSLAVAQWSCLFTCSQICLRGWWPAPCGTAREKKKKKEATVRINYASRIKYQSQSLSLTHIPAALHHKQLSFLALCVLCDIKCAWVRMQEVVSTVRGQTNHWRGIRKVKSASDGGVSRASAGLDRYLQGNPTLQSGVYSICVGIEPTALCREGWVQRSCHARVLVLFGADSSRYFKPVCGLSILLIRVLVVY